MSYDQQLADALREIDRLTKDNERLEKLLASRTTIYAARRVTGGPLGGNGASSVAMDA